MIKVRDLESLIEHLYCTMTGELNDSSVIVNPKFGDDLRDKLIVVNRITDDLFIPRGSNVVARVEYKDFKVIPYNFDLPNLSILPIYLLTRSVDSYDVLSLDNHYYFKPFDTLVGCTDCHAYVNYQIGYSGLDSQKMLVMKMYQLLDLKRSDVTSFRSLLRSTIG